LLFVSLISASAATLQAQTTSSSGLSQYDWPQFMGDSAFTRFSAGPAPSISDVLWSANVTGVQPYLSAFDGMIFAGTNTSIVALDKDTGAKIWETPIHMVHSWPIAYKIDESHLVAEGTCLNPQTGEVIWVSPDFSADTGIFSSNVYSPEEKMFYLKNNSYTEAWSFANPNAPPTFVWRTYVPGGGRTGIGTTYGDGKVFVGSFMNLQMALDAKTGDVLWSTRTKGPMIFDGSYVDGVFLRGGTDDNTMYCFDADTGEIIWTYTPEEDYPYDGGYFTSGTAVAYGNVYEPNKDGYIYAITIATGELAWRYKGPGTLLWPGFASVADGKVYVTSGEIAQYGGGQGTSEFVCLNAFTGEVIWKLPIEALAPRESSLVAYGRLYLIPGTVTDAVDAISGNEYTTFNQVWAIGEQNPPDVIITPPTVLPTETSNMFSISGWTLALIVAVIAVVFIIFLATIVWQDSQKRRNTP
jgi:outer membrane protein assembly factor BamB